ncbi:MAG: tyrosine-protein phosphatase [Clostridia bacterium]|nr:tyrosine-protein phosphatase [Clostridia bacterium]
MKNGLIEENGKLVYYVNDKPVHAGLIKIDGDIYYIGTGGIAVTGKHTIHTSMANGLLKHGVYTFGADGKLKKGSYVPLKKGTHKRRSHFKPKKQLLILGAFLLIALVFVILGFAIDEFGNPDMPVQTTESSAPDEEIKIDLPELSEEAVLVSQGALDAYHGKLSIWEARAYGDPYRPFVFEYDLYGKSGVLYYSENADLSNAVQVALDGNKRSLEIDNLKTGTEYYYKVSVEGKDFTGSFKTAASTRFVKIEGLNNARDIGGYTTLDGKTIKQGMIIRGAEYDGLVESTYQLSKESLTYMQDTFGFAYDMDLRNADIFTGEYTSYLGKDVRHAFYTAPKYGEIFDASYKDSLNRIFSDLAKEENYPMYLHCTYGADRTGTIVFLLQAVLNMSEEEITREYQRTGFSDAGYAASEKYDIILSGLAGKAGNTLQEKTIRFLIDDIGITEEQIDSIQNILLQ